MLYNYETHNPHSIQPSKEESIRDITNKTKGEITKVFELICPTEVSLKRATKNMHNIFDELIIKLTAEK